MTELVLNGLEITTKEELHDRIAQDLNLPDWYGRNLDALYDCLTDLTEDVKITLLSFDVLEQHLGRYAKGLQSMLKDAAAENPHIDLHL